MIDILVGDARTMLAALPDASHRCCVTSPPYFGLRDYGVDGQIGLEQTPEAYVAELVAVFREVRRVLTDDGTLWLNLGDSYSSGGRTTQVVQTVRKGPTPRTAEQDAASGKQEYLNGTAMRPPVVEGLGSKQMLGIPWRVAFALQADGWYLRQDIIWHKPNPMPESVRDRCTKAHEYVFLLSKSPRYFFEPIMEPAVQAGRQRADRIGGSKYQAGVKHSDGSVFTGSDVRNARSVWTITTKPFRGAHFATFPPELAERCILAGSQVGDAVLDPFGGAGTTALAARQHGRRATLVELNPAYADIARDRLGLALTLADLL